MKTQTFYTRIEDLKRLHFIEKQILLHSQNKLSILDVGCGNGMISRFLGEKEHEVLGIDCSVEAIRKANAENVRSNVRFEHCAIEDLHLDEQFDVIICSEVIEHLEDPNVILSFLKKHLKGQGILIVTVPNGFGPRELLITKPLQWMKKNSPFLFSLTNRFKKALGFSGKTIQSDAENLSHLQFFSRRSLKNLLQNQELNVLDWKGSNFIEGVFPFSILSKRALWFQRLDCWITNYLPQRFASGFMTVSRLKNEQFEAKHQPIKILEAIRQGQIGGGETHVLDLVRNLDKSKFDVEVLSFTEGPMVDKLRLMGIQTHVIQSTKPFDIRVWKEVSSLLQAKKYDLVHAHGTRAASNVFYPAKKQQTNLIYTVHGWSFHDGQHPLVRFIREWSEAFLTRKAALNITVSKSNQHDGIKRFGMQKSCVIFNAIDAQKFNPNQELETDLRRELNLPPDKTIVGYLVRMTYQKDPFTMVKAIAELRSQMNDLHFLLMGNGDLLEETKLLAEELELMDLITFSNFREDIPDVLKIIDIYCLPSLWEGMPIGLLEAMAMGKACIATGVDGTNELIEPEQNGILIPKQSPHSLALAIKDLHQNPGKRMKISEQAKKYVAQHFSMDQMVKQIEAKYLQLIQSI